MTNEIRKGFAVGGSLYRGVTDPATGNRWYDTYSVRRVTDRYVFVEPPPGEHREIRLKRRSLERSGVAANSTRCAVFYTELPAEYEKTTLGYIWAAEARAVFGLPPDYTPEMLRDKWLEFARANHPDTGGDAAAFAKGRAAYERLADGPGLGDLLTMIRDATAEENR